MVKPIKLKNHLIVKTSLNCNYPKYHSIIQNYQFSVTIYKVNQKEHFGTLKFSTQIDKYIQIVQQRIGDITQMSKKITDIRINKEMQSIEKQPIPSVLVHREDYLNFHFCFYDLQEQYKKGFYHGVLELPEDYPFSPPKIRFLTNNGRFEVGKSICTTFTHYHKETWSSSWSIRTILTAMISFMYSNEKGIGGIDQPADTRRLLASKSLQQNLKDQKFVELFKQKLIKLGIVTAERISDLMNKIEKSKSRKRERSEVTHIDEVRDIPEIPEELQGAGKNLIADYKNGQVEIIYMAEEAFTKKREMGERDQSFTEQIAQMEIFTKKIKMDYPETEREEIRCLERLPTAQDNQEL